MLLARTRNMNLKLTLMEGRLLLKLLLEGDESPVLLLLSSSRGGEAPKRGDISRRLGDSPRDLEKESLDRVKVKPGRSVGDLGTPPMRPSREDGVLREMEIISEESFRLINRPG